MYSFATNPVTYSEENDIYTVWYDFMDSLGDWYSSRAFFQDKSEADEFVNEHSA